MPLKQPNQTKSNQNRQSPKFLDLDSKDPRTEKI